MRPKGDRATSLLANAADAGGYSLRFSAVEHVDAEENEADEVSNMRLHEDLVFSRFRKGELDCDSFAVDAADAHRLLYLLRSDATGAGSGGQRGARPASWRPLAGDVLLEFEPVSGVSAELFEMIVLRAMLSPDQGNLELEGEREDMRGRVGPFEAAGAGASAAAGAGATSSAGGGGGGGAGRGASGGRVAPATPRTPGV